MVAVVEGKKASAALSEILASREAKALGFSAAGPKEMWPSGTESGLLTTKPFGFILSGNRTLSLSYSRETDQNMSDFVRYTKIAPESLRLT